MRYMGKCIETQTNVVEVHATALNATQHLVSNVSDEDLCVEMSYHLFYCFYCYKWLNKYISSCIYVHTGSSPQYTRTSLGLVQKVPLELHKW